MELKLHENNELKVFIDSDEGLTSGICVRINRALRDHLETSLILGENYALEVSSPGIDRPLKLRRQYVKNIGRRLSVKRAIDGIIEGELKEVGVENILIEIKEKKEIKIIEIPFDQIEWSKVLVSFSKKAKKKK